jgi:hypothetical protein
MKLLIQIIKRIPFIANFLKKNQYLWNNRLVFDILRKIDWLYWAVRRIFDRNGIGKIPGYNQFTSNNVRENSVLIIEANNFHGEVVPGYAQYLSKLGYNVDIIVTMEVYLQYPLNCLQGMEYRQYAFSFDQIFFLLKKQIRCANYMFLFITSELFTQSLQTYSFYQLFPYFPMNNVKIVSHRLEATKATGRKKNEVIVLADFLDGVMVNPHYFGDVKMKDKNKVTTFIVVGTMTSLRKNIQLLIQSVEQLCKLSNQNFKINIIGRQNNTLKLPTNIAKYVEIKGELSFPDMFKSMKDADFFLTLLDPDNPAHDRYITTGTSGSFLLIYGFRKPALIACKFAKYHHLSDSNSLIYETNNDLTNTMLKAIDMPPEEYRILQQNLADTANGIYQTSLNNLKQILS